jgi:ribosomal protein L37AE/L43A
MRIREITSRSRRDFFCVYECEHCGEKKEGSGYDDANFHQNVIPAMTCEHCGKTATKDYVPLAPRYDASVIV